MKPYWKPQHEVFIRSMLRHEDPTKAYRTAYPKAKPASARVGGSRLYGYPHIRQRLEPVLNERRIKAHKEALVEGQERERRALERRDEMRRVLYKVVMKQLRRQRVFTISGRTVTFEEDPSTNTILNAMVLDIRLEAGYNNWPVIERRFARIIASLLPREKQEHSVTNSSSSSINAVISSGAKQSVAEGEISREYATGSVATLQEISPVGRNDALFVREQAGANSSYSPLERGVRQPLSVSGVCRSARETSFAKAEKQEHSVIISPAKPAHTRPATFSQAAVSKVVVTKAKYQQVFPPPADIGFSSKSV